MEDVYPINIAKQEIDISMQFVQQLKLLTMLNISGYKITDQGADMLAELLPKTISLEKLDISSTTLNAAKANKINNALESLSTLKTFDVNNNNIGDEAANSIAAMIKSNPLLKRIDLSDVKLSSAGFVIIAVALSTTKSIKVLDISNNFIASDNIEELATTLSKCAILQELNISQNLLMFTGVVKMAWCFRLHPTLKTLDMSSNAVSFSSACEFTVDVILSVNKEIVNLNVSGRDIRPRFTEDYLSPPDSEKNLSIFAFQDLYLLQHSSLNTVDIQTKFIKVNEPCPIPDNGIISYHVDHTGGTFYNQYNNFALIVPPGAVSKGECVEIQTTASHYGPYKIPNGFYPISSYFWLSADYTFHAQVYLIMSHYAKIRSLEDMDHLYVLQAGVCDSVNKDKTLVMSTVPKGVCFDYEIGYCVLATDHFCSYCQAKNDIHIPEYLLVAFYTYENVAEVCFCPSSSECRKVIIFNVDIFIHSYVASYY